MKSKFVLSVLLLLNAQAFAGQDSVQLRASANSENEMVEELNEASVREFLEVYCNLSWHVYASSFTHGHDEFRMMEAIRMYNSMLANGTQYNIQWRPPTPTNRNLFIRKLSESLGSEDAAVNVVNQYIKFSIKK